MALKFIVVSSIILLFIIYVRAAAFPIEDGSRTLLQYHPNMTTMWMTDDHGRQCKVNLTSRPEHTPPLGNIEDQVFYFLYTREYNSAYQLVKNNIEPLKLSTYNAFRRTKVLIHGFWNNYQSDAVQVVREAYLNSADVNVIAVDWGELALGPFYVEAVSHTEPVGRQVAQFLDFLISAGTKASDIHIIGHSLGAHVAGFASNHVTGGKVIRITGLDPALPLFWLRPPEQRLDPTDADLVDCIHTCGGYLGFYDPLCSHDFYPNGGTASQPGCHWDFTGACSHGRSYRYFGVSIAQNFTARACTSLDDMKHGRCSGVSGVMGDPAFISRPGIYYLETNSYYPYTKS